TAFETDNGRSARQAGTSLHAPKASSSERPAGAHGHLVKQSVPLLRNAESRLTTYERHVVGHYRSAPTWSVATRCRDGTGGAAASGGGSLAISLVSSPERRST